MDEISYLAIHTERRSAYRYLHLHEGHHQEANAHALQYGDRSLREEHPRKCHWPSTGNPNPNSHLQPSTYVEPRIGQLRTYRMH